MPVALHTCVCARCGQAVEYVVTGFESSCLMLNSKPVALSDIVSHPAWALANILVLFACRQAQDKASDLATQAQVKAHELVRDVSP